MRLLDTLNYARQNLGRAKLRTSLTAIGIAIGTAAVVTLLGFAQGVQAISVRQASTFGQITTVAVAQDPKAQPPRPVTPAAMKSLRAIPGVTDVQASVQPPPLRVSIGGHAVDMSGDSNTPLDASFPLKYGSSAGGPDAILLPARFAPQFGVTAQGLVGQLATVTAGGSVHVSGGRKQGTFVAGPDHTYPVKVVGVWNDSGLGPEASASAPVVITAELAAEIDGALNGESAEQYLAQSGYSGVNLVTKDATKTKGIASQVQALGFLAQTRADLLKRLDLFFLILQGGLGTIGGIALLVAAVGIANTMITTVLERTREIGIMKALGAEPGTIRLMFLAETALVGLLGGLAGLLLSFLGGAIGQVIFVRVIQTQNPGFDPGQLFLFPAQLLLAGLALAVGVSLLGGALPSRRAARLQPLDALRYE
jgi:putative ABC transport system permease protein